ncbi:MAG: hypothetical protein NUW01_13780 [Gemmatimonadaceae bacterium]|nr:hypothetical protein [Gemmatimonadaceae bacterium]
MTNATKAQVVVLVNALLVLVTSFGVDLADGQRAAVEGAVNAALALWVGLTYKNSSKRVDG